MEQVGGGLAGMVGGYGTGVFGGGGCSSTANMSCLFCLWLKGGGGWMYSWSRSWLRPRSRLWGCIPIPRSRYLGGVDVGEVSSHCIYTSTILFTIWDTMMQESCQRHLGAMVQEPLVYILSTCNNSMHAGHLIRPGTVISVPKTQQRRNAVVQQTPHTPARSHEK